MRKLRLSPVLLTTIAVAVTGTHMGYGFIVSGVRDRTVTGNVDNSFGVPATEQTSFDLRASASSHAVHTHPHPRRGTSMP